MLLSPTEARILLGKTSDEIGAGSAIVPQAVRLQLMDANPSAKIAGRDPLSAKANYFIGSESPHNGAGVSRCSPGCASMKCIRACR